MLIPLSNLLCIIRTVSTKVRQHDDMAQLTSLLMNEIETSIKKKTQTEIEQCFGQLLISLRSLITPDIVELICMHIEQWPTNQLSTLPANVDCHNHESITTV